MEEMHLPYRPACAGCGEVLLSLFVDDGEFALSLHAARSLDRLKAAGMSQAVCACGIATVVTFQMPEDEDPRVNVIQ